MIDLHTHSSASDGTLAPAQLMREAAKIKLDVIALTDHDTIEGIEEARKEADKLGLHLVQGVELEIEKNTVTMTETEKPLPESGEFHLLGLGLDKPCDGFTALLKDLKQKREDRNKQIIQKMCDMGMDADYDELVLFTKEKYSKGESAIKRNASCIGRPHFAQYLITLKKVKNVDQAFGKYLAKGQPLYVAKTGADFSQAASLIQKSGGIAVLAHPTSLYVSWSRLSEIFRALKAQGLNGIEAWHPIATVHLSRRMEALGESLGLSITAGSDFHGENRPNRSLGRTSGKLKIEDRFLKALCKDYE